MSQTNVKEGPYAYKYLAADGQVKGSTGFLHSLVIAPVGAVTAGVITVYDSLTETGTVIATIYCPTGLLPTTLVLDVGFNTGLFIGFDGTIANVGTTSSYQ